MCVDKSEYVNKMNMLLSDKNTYKFINRSKTLLEKLQKSSHKLSTHWNNNGWLQKNYKNFEITQTNTVIPRIYGLPKLHKFD